MPEPQFDLSMSPRQPQTGGQRRISSEPAEQEPATDEDVAAPHREYGGRPEHLRMRQHLLQRDAHADGASGGNRTPEPGM